jgi:hypothetical protein
VAGLLQWNIRDNEAELSFMIAVWPHSDDSFVVKKLSANIMSLCFLWSHINHVVAFDGPLTPQCSAVCCMQCNLEFITRKFVGIGFSHFGR